MKFEMVAAVAVFGVALSGCATIVKGTTQSISVATPPVTGATCTLTSSEGTWYVTTPGSVTVHKTKNNIKVLCKKEGYKDADAVILSHFNGATAGNILAGGVIGLGVDAASGANYTYTSSSEIPMAPLDSTAQPQAPTNTVPAPSTS